MKYDVIIVGGSYAGMAAALQLVRARRTVLVIDKGLRRNRFAFRSHGFLGQDGTDAAEIASVARQQVMAYPTARWNETLAQSVSGTKDDFTIKVEDGESYASRRLLFATGVSDTLPAIAGIGERWGKSVFHCPYCHGYELDQGRLAVIATGPLSLHQAQLIPEWGDVTFFTNGALTLDADARADLHARGVLIEEEPVVEVANEADIHTADGRVHRFAGIFIATRNAPATDIAVNFGCAVEETPLGTQIATNAAKETNVAGAFACGDAARAPHSLSLAVADGAWAGMQLHRSLVF